MKVIIIGRSAECDIVVQDGKASRKHLQLVQDDGGNVSAIDLGSTNGTYVNGNRIGGECRLRAGDELRIGDTVLPWQTYLSPAASVGPDVVPVPPAPPRKKKTVLLIVLIVVGVIVIGAAAWWFIGGRQGEKPDGDPTHEPALEQQVSDAVNQAEKEYLQAQNKALQTGSEADRRKADSIGQVLTNARNHETEMKKQLEATTKQKQDLDKKLNEAVKKQSELDQKNKEADSLAKVAEKKAMQAEKDNQALQQKLATANATSEVTEEFYSLMSKASNSAVSKIFNHLSGDNSLHKDKRAYIEKRFREATSLDEKKQILNTVKQNVSHEQPAQP